MQNNTNEEKILTPSDTAGDAARGGGTDESENREINSADVASAIKEASACINRLGEKINTLEEENAELSKNIEKLRDQMFVLSMVEVTQDGVVRHESYHNIMLDEICALRSDVDALKNDVDALKNDVDVLKNGEEVKNLVGDAKEQAENLTSVMKEVLQSLDDIKTRMNLSELKKDDPDPEAATQSKDQLTKSLDELKKELTKIAEDFSE